MNIKQIYLQASATSERIDVELLLSKALKKPRVYLHAHSEEKLTEREWNLFQEYWNRYQKGEPVAYILGEVEFYSLNFLVSPSVLIPRPETELLVELVLEKFLQPRMKVLELGTGSGVISVSLGKHRPKWEITAGDVSEYALDVARKNAYLNQVENIKFFLSDWYQNITPFKKPELDLIVSNPPYVSEGDPHLEQLSFEPQIALVSGKEGFDAIQIIIQSARDYLKLGGHLVLEHGYNQQEVVQQYFKQQGFSEIKTVKDLNHHPRLTIAKLT